MLCLLPPSPCPPALPIQRHIRHQSGRRSHGHRFRRRRRRRRQGHQHQHQHQHRACHEYHPRARPLSTGSPPACARSSALLTPSPTPPAPRQSPRIHAQKPCFAAPSVQTAGRSTVQPQWVVDCCTATQRLRSTSPLPPRVSARPRLRAARARLARARMHGSTNPARRV
eukprot:1501713-Pleurochrysis_carterae.AAC.2